MDSNQVDEGCTWTGDPQQRTLRHLTQCKACERRWPMLTADVRERMNHGLGTTGLALTYGDNPHNPHNPHDTTN